MATSRVCLFCTNRAGSKEHAWPRWLISSVGADPESPTEYWNTVMAPPHLWRGPEFTMRGVCQECNNGWMCELEGTIRATMGGLVNDISMRLDEEQQRLLARWAAKTAMVIEGVKQEKNNFYSAEQRNTFRTTLIPPEETAVWLGRCAQSNLLHGEARKLHVSNQRPTNPLEDGCATTFVTGRLVMQVLSVKRKPDAPMKTAIPAKMELKRLKAPTAPTQTK
jgi:hypothetical protein